MQIIFLSGTKCLWLPQYVNKFLVWHEIFGPAQNILGPVKGQGITLLFTTVHQIPNNNPLKQPYGTHKRIGILWMTP
jgi:hypothetical protein